uniref:Uncharacterized protein n=1 Tax=Anguilla anguilla TaxID=7936 RepID=A0A0E9R4N8_ANGAN
MEISQNSTMTISRHISIQCSELSFSGSLEYKRGQMGLEPYSCTSGWC